LIPLLGRDQQFEAGRAVAAAIRQFHSQRRQFCTPAGFLPGIHTAAERRAAARTNVW